MQKQRFEEVIKYLEFQKKEYIEGKKEVETEKEAIQIQIKQLEDQLNDEKRFQNQLLEELKHIKFRPKSIENMPKMKKHQRTRSEVFPLRLKQPIPALNSPQTHRLLTQPGYHSKKKSLNINQELPINVKKSLRHLVSHKTESILKKGKKKSMDSRSSKSRKWKNFLAMNVGVLRNRSGSTAGKRILPRKRKGRSGQFMYRRLMGIGSNKRPEEHRKCKPILLIPRFQRMRGHNLASGHHKSESISQGKHG